MKKIRVGLADDHRIVLEGLGQLLSLEPDLEVVFRTSSGEEALAEVERTAPDVCIVDVRMPGVDGLAFLETMRKRGTKVPVVLLTAHITEQQVIEAVRLGVGGIVLKEAAPRMLVQCIRAVAAGERWLDHRTIQGALESLLRREAGVNKSAETLTRREIEIVQMVATGLRNKEIAEKLKITEGTVKVHLHSIYEKLGIGGRVELSNYARDNALV